MTAPLLSVIIPTHNRPQYLPRAVESALQAAPNGDVEVIVVPNGGDHTWKESLANLLHDPRIIVLPIEKGHANVARNHGLRLAKGKYVRFLDDDDFLYTDIAKEQLMNMMESNAEVSSYGIRIENEMGEQIRNWLPKVENNDFIYFCISPNRLQQMTSLLFLKYKIKSTLWDESLPYSQDICWLLDLCINNEFRWYYKQSLVGAWVHHQSERISKKSDENHRKSLIVERILKLEKQLIRENRLNADRRFAIASALWQYIFSEFYKNFSYWHYIAQEAKRVCPEYKCNVFSSISPKFKKIIFESSPMKVLPIISFIFLCTNILKKIKGCLKA